jgi:hypothetical protein
MYVSVCEEHLVPAGFAQFFSYEIMKVQKYCLFKSMIRRGTFLRVIGDARHERQGFIGVNAALTRHFDHFQLFFGLVVSFRFREFNIHQKALSSLCLIFFGSVGQGERPVEGTDQ